MIEDLSSRSREILRHIVEAYCETGEPIGSKSLSQRLGLHLSPATIRNIMSDLERLGLLYAPHTSAGRLPTEQGLRMFIHGLLEVGDISQEERTKLEILCASKNKNLDDILEETTTTLSGLTQCAGLVLAPKSESPLKHVEFVSLSPGRALVILITESGVVENRVVEIPTGMPHSSLVEAGNYLTQKLSGKSLSEARRYVLDQLEADRATLDDLAGQLVKEGIAVWSGTQTPKGSLIIRGQANLLKNLEHEKSLDQIRGLFQALETQESLKDLLDAAIEAEGVQIFVGSENPLFKNSGCSLIISPYKSESGRIMGALGVIGPTHINYGRIIPMVDYTAKMIGHLIGGETKTRIEEDDKYKS